MSDSIRDKAREAASDEAPPEVHPLIAFEQDAANRISVPAEGESAHPLVLRTERFLKRAKRDADGLIISPTGAYQVHTSRALHERALRIVQALLRAFETRGLPFCQPPKVSASGFWTNLSGSRLRRSRLCRPRDDRLR